MPTLPTPDLDTALLVRTDFTDDARWDAARAAAGAETEEGFSAGLAPVDDSSWADASVDDLRSAALAAGGEAAVLFAVDAAASAGDFPILVIDLEGSNPAFRCVAAELWSVENNLNVGNMDWAEFADHVDADGIYRGLE